MFEAMEKVFGLKQVNVAEYSPLTFAYIGDCVYELIIRTMLVSESNAPVNKLNKRASNLAKAATQSAMAEAIMESLTEEEISKYRARMMENFGRGMSDFYTAHPDLFEKL